MRKTLPAAQRILGSSHEFTLRVMGCYAEALYLDTGATRSDLREAVTTLEDAAQIVRRVLGGVHPITEGIVEYLQEARTALGARETPPGGA